MAQLNVTLNANQAKALADALAVSLDRVATGARNVDRSVDGAERRLGALQRRASTLGPILSRVFAIAGAAIGIRTIVGFTDSYTQMENRIRSVSNSQKDLNAVFESLQRVSATTRTDLAANVSLYSRLAPAGRELGLSQGELINVISGVGKAFKLSGASAIETSQGIRQLSQAMQSGRLSGDELRSVMEASGITGQVLAKSLGVSVGALRDLGAEGKITAQVLVKAFSDARSELDDKFGSALPTVGESLNVFRDRATVVVGRLDRLFVVSQSVSNALLFMSGATDTLTTGGARVLVVFKALAGTLGTIAILKVGAFFIALTKDIAAATIAMLRMVPATLAVGVALATAFSSFNIGKTLFDEVPAIQNFLNFVTTEILVFVERVKGLFAEIRIEIGEAFSDTSNPLKAFENFLFGTKEYRDKFFSEQRQGEASEQTRFILRQVATGEEGPIPPPAAAGDSLQSRIAAARAAASRQIESILDADRAEYERIAEGFRNRDAGDQKGFVEALKENLANQLQLVGSFTKEQIEKYTAILDEIKVALGSSTTTEEIEALLRNAPGSTISGGGGGAGPGGGNVENDIKRLSFGLQTIEDAAQGAGREMGNIFSELREGSVDAFDALKRILDTIIDIIAQALILQAIGSFGVGGKAGTGLLGLFSSGSSSARGNAFQSGSKVNYLASGGILSGLTVFPGSRGELNVAGEAGDEAIFPITRNPRTGNLAVEAVGAGGGNTVNFYIQTQDVESFRRSEKQVMRRLRASLEASQ